MPKVLINHNIIGRKIMLQKTCFVKREEEKNTIFLTFRQRSG